MKEIHRSSVIFLFISGLDKSIISRPKITCNGKNLPFVSKDEGYNIFNDLEYGHYCFDVHCNGFFSKNYEIDIKKGEFSPEIVDTLNPTVMHQKAVGAKKVIFTVTKDGRPIPEEKITVSLESRVPSLRVIKPIQKDGLIRLNSKYDKNIAYQYYTYEESPQNPFYISDFDYGTNSYKSNLDFEKDIEEDGTLNPIWELTTDDKGRVLLPINPLFMQKEAVDFKIETMGQEKKITAKTTGSEYITINL